MRFEECGAGLPAGLPGGRHGDIRPAAVHPPGPGGEGYPGPGRDAPEPGDLRAGPRTRPADLLATRTGEGGPIMKCSENPIIYRIELEKRLNTMELSFQRQLQKRDDEIKALKLRISDLEKGGTAG